MNDIPKRNAAIRWVALGFLLIGGGLFFGIYKYSKSLEPLPRHLEGYVPWSADTIAVAESIPVQEGGRIKPLSTMAGFAMYQIHGNRELEIDIKDTSPEAKTGKDGLPPHKVLKLKPTAWLLDCLFRPQVAVEMPTFVVDNSDVITAIGLTPGAKRDRYSYHDLEPGRDKLKEQAKSYQAKEAAERGPVGEQIVNLETNVEKYESLIGYFSFVRGVTMRNPTGTNSRNAQVSLVMTAAPQIRESLAGRDKPEHVMDLVEQVNDMANLAHSALLLFPPDGQPQADKPESRAWTSAGDEIWSTMIQESPNPERSIARIKLLEEVTYNANVSDDAFRVSLSQLRDLTVAAATARGEYRAIQLESSYYNHDWFLNAIVFFLLASILGIGMWGAGWNLTGRILAWATGGLTAFGWVYCVIAIGQRCYIMQRPPIGNLYDTVICIATAIVLLSFVVELLTRKRFALGLAPVIGAALILIARQYEVGDAKDHMDPLVAVLRSNYWLTIHVITITMGYTAGLFTALISHIYLFMRGTGLDAGDRSLRRTLTRAAYGCVCFTLFLSLVGTVLGGVWANDSWGRFWGWDPKENGALLIVLWNLAILHARLGGYLKEWSFHLACVAGSCVVVFSWWHVNFFNTGLHSYGFTSGKGIVWMWYGLEALYILLGIIAWIVWTNIENDEKERRAALRAIADAA